MARVGTPLDAGDRFPLDAVDTVAHGRVSLPVPGIRRTAVLFYRAHW